MDVERKELDEVLEQLPRQERFNSLIATINTLLIQKGIITPEEMAAYSLEDAKAKLKNLQNGTTPK